MSDLDRIKRNVSKMAQMGAPEEDIDGYIASEGVTVEQVRAHQIQPAIPVIDPAGEDAGLAKAAGVGAVQGALGLVTLPRSLEQLGRAGINYASQALGGGQVVDPNSTVTGWPSYSDAKQFVEGYTGEFYKPKTVAEEYARTAGEFLPAALGGGGAISRAARVAVPAVASETAGQLTKGTEYEGPARVAGAVVGSIAPSVALRQATSGARSKAVRKLKSEGVTALTESQKTGSQSLRRFEDAANQIPFSGRVAEKMQSKAGEQFTGAVLKRALSPQTIKDIKKNGGNPNLATEDVLSAAIDAFKADYGKLANKLQITPDQKLLRDLQAVGREYVSTSPAGSVRPMIADAAQDLASKGPMTGVQAAKYISRLKEKSRGMAGDKEAQNAILDIIRLLQDNMVKNMGQRSGQGAAEALRKEMKTLHTRYRNYIAVEDAVAASTAENFARGVITPAKLRAAVKKQGKRQLVSGKSDLGNLARAGDEVLTLLPTSGTAERTQYIGLLSNPLSFGSGGTGATIGTLVAGPVGGVAGAVAGAMAPGLAARGLMNLSPLARARLPVSEVPQMGGLGGALRSYGTVPYLAAKDEE